MAQGTAGLGSEGAALFREESKTGSNVSRAGLKLPMQPITLKFRTSCLHLLVLELQGGSPCLVLERVLF